MTDAANTSFIARTFDRAKLARVADWLAVAIVASLPWSTSVSAILIPFWLVALLPSLTWPDLKREFQTLAGGLPMLLWLLAALGMLWSPADFADRIAFLGAFHKLLVIPLLLAQFRRSDRGTFVLYGFLATCTVLLAVSWVLKIALAFDQQWAYIPNKAFGVPVRDYIAQSTEFLICVFCLLALAIERWREGQNSFAAGLVVLSVLFLANIMVISTGRTALVILPILFVLLGYRYFRWKGVAAGLMVSALVFAASWNTSSFLRERTSVTISELQRYQDEVDRQRQQNESSPPSAPGESTPAAPTVRSAPPEQKNFTGMRAEFLKNGAQFFREAPIFGHGTGSTPGLYERASAGQSGTAGVRSVNPHNQFLAIAIQLGLIGGLLVIAMWFAHLALFRGPGLIAWFGIVMVSQNVISSMFNSHLFDFLHGWIYVFGFGVLGGMALRRKADAPR